MTTQYYFWETLQKCHVKSKSITQQESMAEIAIRIIQIIQQVQLHEKSLLMSAWVYIQTDDTDV